MTAGLPAVTAENYNLLVLHFLHFLPIRTQGGWDLSSQNVNSVCELRHGESTTIAEVVRMRRRSQQQLELTGVCVTSHPEGCWVFQDGDSEVETPAKVL